MKCTFTVATDIDGNGLTTSHGVRVNDMVIIALSQGTIKCFVSAVVDAVVTCYLTRLQLYAPAAFADTGVPSANNATLLVMVLSMEKVLQGKELQLLKQEVLKPTQFI